MSSNWTGSIYKLEYTTSVILPYPTYKAQRRNDFIAAAHSLIFKINSDYTSLNTTDVLTMNLI